MIPATVPGKGLTLGISVANTWPLRFRGLLKRPAPGRHEALLITRCTAVHTLGMAYPIDIVFLDRRWRVVGIVHRVPPGRWKVAAQRRSGAVQVLEMRDGEAQALGLRPGQRLRPRHRHAEGTPTRAPAEGSTSHDERRNG